MEETPGKIEQDPIKKLSEKEKFEVLLGLFGTSEARDRFISICREYNGSKTEQIVQNEDSENYKQKRKVIYSPPKRAALHNKIMEIIGRLAVESRNLTALQQSILRDFYSRESVAQAIKKYIMAEDTLDEKNDEDEIMRRKSNMSDTAFFHSLGREH